MATEREQVVQLMQAAEEARRLGMDPEKIRKTFRPRVPEWRRRLTARDESGRIRNG